jgi:hypothetical protein
MKLLPFNDGSILYGKELVNGKAILWQIENPG